MSLAVQMYTLRDFTRSAEALSRTFEAVRDIGYEAVQLSAIACMSGENPTVDAARARKILDEFGLSCIATHRTWNDLVENTEAEIDFHHELRCSFAAIGGIPTSYGERGAEGYREFLRDAAPVVQNLKSAGIKFGYHNHAHEFQRIDPEAPATLYDILLEEGGADFNLEVDVYWVQHAGVTPESILKRGTGRVPVIHLKDKAVVSPDGPVMAAIGEGNFDWDSILSACILSGVQWFAVEQDICMRDPFDCLKSSFDYLTRKGL